MADYVAGRGTTALGIIGTTLGAIGAAGGLNLLPGANTGMCSDNMPINRREADQAQELARKEAEIVYWRGQDTTNTKITEAYAKLENQIKDLACEVRGNKTAQDGVNLQQAVYNGTNTAAVSCIQSQVAQLFGLTKMVVPNSSVCPGWGEVTVSPAAAPTT